MALTDVSRHCTIPAEAPQQSDLTPKAAVGPGDSQHGVTELIAAYGAGNNGLASLQVRRDHDLPRAAASHPDCRAVLRGQQTPTGQMGKWVTERSRFQARPRYAAVP